MENSNNLYQMRAVTRHIENVPEEWQSTNDWDSHLPAIYLVLLKDKETHPLAEFGSGHSTQIINEYCRGHRKFESYENDKEWCVIPSKYVDDYSKVHLMLGYIVFIDGKPGEERKLLIERYKNNHLLIIHDTEPGADYVYHMSEVLSTFKYRLDYQPEGKPHTTVVSNTVNVCTWI